MTSRQSNYWASALFADDLRYEIDDKESLIGVQRGTLFIAASPPAPLPVLIVYVTYYQSVSEEELPIKVLIYLPGVPEDPKQPSRSLEVDLQSIAPRPRPEGAPADQAV
jgi:hypothetical protein